MKKIGTANGHIVLYGDGIVIVSDTDVMIIGCQSEQDAVKRARLNLRNFKEV